MWWTGAGEATSVATTELFDRSISTGLAHPAGTP